MNFEENILDNLKNNQFLLVIFLIILIFSLISSVSASDSFDMDNSNSNTILQSNEILNSEYVLNKENTLELDTSDKSEKNVISTSSIHKISSDSTNDEIQSIFDNSKSGDTIQFNDKEYNNISIVVNKKLNIVSTKSSILHISDSLSNKANQMGLANTFGFYFTKSASGSVIKGLSLTGNSDYGIMVEGGSSISILNNNISGGKKAGIYLKNSKSNTIKNNILTKAYDGIVLNNVNKTRIISNRIQQNRNTGIVLENVNGNNITRNIVSKNGLDGVLLKNAKSNNILRNNITKNGVSGLRMEGFTTKNVIMYNNISSNVVNVYANSLTNSDKMTKNTLMFAKKVFGTYIDDDNVGAAIVFGDNYRSVEWHNLDFSYNSIGMNEVWDAKSTMSHPPVNIGANWYFDNDGNYAIGHICPMVFGRAITADELKTLSMGFSSDGKGIFGQLYDGKTVAGAGSFTIDNVIIDGKDYGSAEVGEDGRFNLDLSSLPAGSVVTINISGHTFNITIDEEVQKKNSEQSADEDDKKSTKEGTNPQTLGNGTGSGSGSSNGSGSGEGNFTGSGVSVGDLSGQSNQGTGDSGENGGGSSSEGKAYEILKEQNTPVTAKNSQLIAVFAVALVILIIALGYRSKNKDDYKDDGDYSL